MPRLLLPCVAALALALAPGCHRITVAIDDDENPDTVFLTPIESGGDATSFEEKVVVYTSLFGLISWTEASAEATLAKYYNTGKIQNLRIEQGQDPVEGFVTLVTGYGLLVGMRHVTYKGDVVRRIGG